MDAKTTARGRPAAARRLSRNLEKFLAERRLGPDDVAELTGTITAQTVRNCLHGTYKPTLRTLEALAQGLGVEISELLA